MKLSVSDLLTLSLSLSLTSNRLQQNVMGERVDWVENEEKLCEKM